MPRGRKKKVVDPVIEEVKETKIEEIQETPIEDIQEVPVESLIGPEEVVQPSEDLIVEIEDIDGNESEEGIGAVFVDEEGNVFDVDASDEFNNGKGDDEDE